MAGVAQPRSGRPQTARMAFRNHSHAAAGRTASLCQKRSRFDHGSSGLLWLLWSLVTPSGRITPISGWLLGFLAVAVLATGFSPVPMDAAKGLIKLLSYLGVYALLSKLLQQEQHWWDRLLAAPWVGH